MRTPRTTGILVVTAVVIVLFIWKAPAIWPYVLWRYEVWTTRWINARQPMSIPTPLASTPFPTFTPRPPTPTLVASPWPSPTPLPLPPEVILPSPPYERQDINNCGPATLSMLLHMYGWQGDQYDIARIVKPVRQDRNVNPEELRYYVLNYAGWLQAEYRVAGDVDLLKRLLAAGYPVLIEAATPLRPEDAAGPNDDLWSAHYLVITGYDDLEGVVIAQDPLRGPDKRIPYAQLRSDWKPFNYLYLVLYFPQYEEEMRSLLGEDWDVNANRQRALEMASADVAADPNDAFAWFNLGASLTYFERYGEAAQAFDRAFTIGLPQRMTRYQFWPFFAYFHAGHIDYLLELTESTYRAINGWYSEEALLWNGWGLWRKGDVSGAIARWRKALDVHPGYPDALYALQFVGAQP